MTLPSSPTQFDFWTSLPTSQDQAELFGALLTNSHLPTLTVKSSPAIADKAKTNIVVVVVAPIIVDANRRAAIIRIVVPRTAPKSGSPTPSSIPRKYKGTEYLLS